MVVSETNTTKFDTCQTPRAIAMLTDIDGNLVITEDGKKKVENQAMCRRRTTGSSSSGLQTIRKKRVMLADVSFMCMTRIHLPGQYLAGQNTPPLSYRPFLKI